MAGIICLLFGHFPNLSEFLAGARPVSILSSAGMLAPTLHDDAIPWAARPFFPWRSKRYCPDPGMLNGDRERSIKDGHSGHAGSCKGAGTRTSSRTASSEMAEIRGARLDRAAGCCDPRHDHMELERLGGWAGRTSHR